MMAKGLVCRVCAIAGPLGTRCQWCGSTYKEKLER